MKRKKKMAQHKYLKIPPFKKRAPHSKQRSKKRSKNKFRIIFRLKGKRYKPYAVPPCLRILSPQALWKYHEVIRRFLKDQLGLSTAQREVVFRLLRLFVYYGQVYPKAKQVSSEPGCSIRTFWRTISILEQMGLLLRVNRFLIREKAQISNLYVLDKLILAIAKAIRERRAFTIAKEFLDLATASWSEFWEVLPHWDLMGIHTALSPPA